MVIKLNARTRLIVASQVILLLICCNHNTYASIIDSYVANGIGITNSHISILTRRRRELNKNWHLGALGAESKTMERSKEVAHRHTRHKLKSVAFANVHQGVIHYSFRHSMSFGYIPKKPKEPKDREHPKESKEPKDPKHPTQPKEPKNPKYPKELKEPKDPKHPTQPKDPKQQNITPTPHKNGDKTKFSVPDSPTESEKEEKPTMTFTEHDNEDSSIFIPTFIQCPHQPKSSLNIEIQFLYSVETKGEDVREFLDKIEWAMMKRISEKMMHCSSLDSDGQGVVRVDSSPKDSVLTKCQPSQSEASSCQQLIGNMKVHVIPYEKAETATIAVVQNLIESDCKNGYYVKDVNISPDLVKVNYIGDGDSPFVISGIASDSQGHSGPESSTILAASLAPVAFLGLLAAALFGARKRTVSTGFQTTHEDGQKSYILSVSDPSLSEASTEWDHGRERLYGVFGNTYFTHNVHTCKSATCQLCYNQKSFVQFIRSPKVTCPTNLLTSIVEEEDDNSVL